MGEVRRDGARTVVRGPWSDGVKSWRFDCWQPQTGRWIECSFPGADRSAARRRALGWARERGYTLRPESHSGDSPITEGGGLVNDARDTETRAMEKVDAMIGFLAALEQLGPHMEAIGQLCATAVELQRWGNSFDLQVQGMTRDEYDHFDGEDTHFPPTEDRSHEFWSKTVIVYDGSIDMAAEPRSEGGVKFTLYTRFAPVQEPALA